MAEALASEQPARPRAAPARATAVPRPRGLPPPLLLLLYLAVVLAPLVLAALRGGPPRHWRDELASALALLGFSVFFMEFLLSGRFRFVSGRIGIDRTMRIHQLLARTALLFVLVHPFLYTTALVPWDLPFDPTGRASLGLGGPSILSGVVAWLLFALLVLLAIGRDLLPYPYEAWRASHGLGALLVAGLGTHHALEAGRYSADPWLAGFWLALLALAAFTLLNVYVLRPLGLLARPFRIEAVEKIADRTWSVRLVEERPGRFAFRAGQFAWATLDRSPFSLVEHPFSIASAPADLPRVEFVIKEAGDFTSRLDRLRIGGRAYLEGPHGNFTLEGRDAAGVALVAGGVGVAPVLSLLRQAAAERDPRPWLLIYGNRHAGQIVHREELESLASRLDLRIVHVLGEPPEGWKGEVGQLDRALLARHVDPARMADWLFFVCGPPAMIEAVEEALVSLGVRRGRIVAERFRYDVG
ncbi:MAG: ferredoxin reductase family protein [Geminicoccaceae bacterium]|nr:ferredoxin reductase family protein [Geminicoccaceae bacterium]MCS7268037.1 ferredoxin reductase family protein [Geminicoccaceae bacterium]MCX7629810.1 ferredoxin reductase family protein [Geminicoccaceae bacterium]MDW8124748.1 ferredoxin reductase family protein [Geminicoccaceae bacterium]MDW8341415.1 ferredoxin reductase family protein [Geminicoccaceae bacterium]